MMNHSPDEVAVGGCLAHSPVRQIGHNLRRSSAYFDQPLGSQLRPLGSSAEHYLVQCEVLLLLAQELLQEPKAAVPQAGQDEMLFNDGQYGVILLTGIAEVQVEELFCRKFHREAPYFCDGIGLNLLKVFEKLRHQFQSGKLLILIHTSGMKQ